MKAVSKATPVKQPLGVTAYEQIYRRIMTLEYAPGRPLDEKLLMAELGIGRTPIREALLRLASDFMVESQPNRGCIVRPIALQNPRAAFAALKMMELDVAELALKQDNRTILPLMSRANDEVEAAVRRHDIIGLVEANSRFHAHFARCSRNDYLIHALGQVSCETNRLAYLSYGNEIDPLRTLGEHYDSVVDQHRKIIDCLQHHDEDCLKTTLQAHSRIFQDRIIMYMAS
ncbi:MAG: GntR family transcriptional regulator [Desulfosarcina sp.]|nr:GntR family transcriptional regulator [Desulfobacterales bacterium]